MKYFILLCLATVSANCTDSKIKSKDNAALQHKYNLIQLCEFTKDVSKRDWAIKEISKHFTDAFATSSKQKNSTAKEEEDFLHFTEFFIENPAIDLLDAYYTIYAGSAMSELQLSTIANFMSEHPDLFFSWDKCGEASNRVIDNMEISFESPQDVKKCLNSLKKYYAENGATNANTVKNCIAQIKTRIEASNE